MPTGIEWTDETWNPVTGCTKVSPGCANCYITSTPPFRIAGRTWDEEGHIPLVFHPERLDRPLRWRKPRMIFVNSLSDLFHEDVPEEFIEQVFETMVLASHHIFQVLTKRPERMRSFLLRRFADSAKLRIVGHEVPWPAPNIWLGTTIESGRFTYRADILRETPAAVRFISAEPLIGSLFVNERKKQPLDLTGIDWLICGGESGKGDVRQMHPDWARELRDACQASGTAFFFKQWGEWAPGDQCGVRNTKMSSRRFQYESRRFAPDGTEYDARKPDLYSYPGMESLLRVGKRKAGRMLDGREWNEMPGEGRLAA